MNYKIVILLVLTLFLGFLIDRAFVKYAPLPCDNNASNPANPACAENNNDDKAKDDTNITYKTFSSPKADFTFEYPSDWVYEEKQNAYNTNETDWIFYSDSQKNIDNLIFATGTSNNEWVDFCSGSYYKHGISKSSYQLNTFPTNDPETFVTYEQCGEEYGGAYIYWQRGEYFANADDIKDVLKINLMVYYSGIENNSREVAEHIAQSIKIK